MTGKLVPAAMTLGLLVGGGCCPRHAAVRTAPVFPATAGGWTVAGGPQTFGRRTLYDYMDGAGEHYLAYGFQRLHVQEYRREGAPRIVAEAYAMGTSADAYGVYSHDPEGADARIGQGSAYGAGLLRLWKGAWWFRILAERETPEAKAAVLAIGRALAAPIAEGPRPALLDRLPAADRDAHSVRYFHTAFSLSTVHYLADDNVLALSPRTEAAFAAYRRGGSKLKLLIVRYTTARRAAAAYRGFNRLYLQGKPPPAGPRRIVPVEQGRHLGVLVRKHFIAIVLEAPSRASCDRLLTEAAQQLDGEESRP